MAEGGRRAVGDQEVRVGRWPASPQASPPPLMDPTEAACQGLSPNHQIVPRSPPAA